MNISNFEIIVRDNIPNNYKEQIFEFEKNTFENVYRRCPKTIEEFDNRYKNRNLRIVMCVSNNQLLGFRLFEIFNKSQVQSMFMVVKEDFRGMKISNLICSTSSEYFKLQGFKYISSWTHISITASKIMAKYAPYVSTADNLDETEKKLLNEFELRAGKPIGFYGLKRKVLNFYEMLDNRDGHAFFWAHKI